MAASRRNWFSDLPGGAPADRVEDAACRALLRHARVPAGAVARRLGVEPSSRLTFRQLDEAAGFPSDGVVATGVPPDPVPQLLYRFAKSRLFGAWEGCDFPGGPRDRAVLLGRGPEWGFFAAWRLPAGHTPPARPHVLVGHPGGYFLVVESLAAWAEFESGWDGGDLRAPGECDGGPEV